MGGLKERFPTAVVTGPSSGLGFAFTKMLLEEGVAVLGVSRQPDVFPNEPGYEPITCDLSNVAHVKSVFKEIFQREHPVSLVINNAGYGVLEMLAEMDFEKIQHQYQVMLEAPTIISSLSTKHFAKNGHGCLVNVSSLAVELPLPLMSVYNTTKAGLSALSESLILEELENRFTVIDFRPGDFNTPFAAQMEGEVHWNGINLREVMDDHHASAPDVSLAVEGLRRALIRNRSGVVRVGNFFQARIAPLGRFLPRHWLRWLIRQYYKR
ncbi:MAG: SDR family NAD(P)-dependent oxidoreductase [Verrucomicrobiota bacterium]